MSKYTQGQRNFILAAGIVTIVGAIGVMIYTLLRGTNFPISTLLLIVVAMSAIVISRKS